MRRYSNWTYALALAVAVALVAGGCGKRVNPVAEAPQGPEGAVQNFTHDLGPSGANVLPAPGEGLTLTESPLRTSKVYLPPGYRVQGEGRPYPVLFLLQDFGGNGQAGSPTDEQFFLDLGLARIADSMILVGEIKPMIIASIDLYNAYGGSWYTSNSVQGDYEGALLAFVQYADDNLNVYSEQGRAAHAIGGVGMGGYGALMMAMRYPEQFSSASSVNGFLAFTQTSVTYNYNGISEWIPRVFEENFATPLPPDEPTTPTSLGPYYSMKPDIVNALRKPYTNLMCSMAAAFSPRIAGGDSTTWLNPAMAGLSYRDWKVRLPFTWTGELWTAVFGMWKQNDPSYYVIANPTALANTSIHVETGTTTDFNLLQQNRIFRDAAVRSGVPDMEYVEFDGYPDYPTTGRRYIADRLRAILKFHSDHLYGPYYLGP